MHTPNDCFGFKNGIKEIKCIILSKKEIRGHGKKEYHFIKSFFVRIITLPISYEMSDSSVFRTEDVQILCKKKYP